MKGSLAADLAIMEHAVQHVIRSFRSLLADFREVDAVGVDNFLGCLEFNSNPTVEGRKLQTNILRVNDSGLACRA